MWMHVIECRDCSAGNPWAWEYSAFYLTRQWPQRRLKEPLGRPSICTGYSLAPVFAWLFFSCKMQALHRFLGQIPCSITPRNFHWRQRIATIELKVALTAFHQPSATKTMKETLSDPEQAMQIRTRRIVPYDFCSGAQLSLPLGVSGKQLKLFPSLSCVITLLNILSKASIWCLNNCTDQRLWEIQETNRPARQCFQTQDCSGLSHVDFPAFGRREEEAHQTVLIFRTWVSPILHLKTMTNLSMPTRSKQKPFEKQSWSLQPHVLLFGSK